MHKFIISALAISLINLTLMTQSTNAFEAPSFCNGIECPEYKLLSSKGEIEMREYKKSYWVSTSTKSDNRNGFFTLFNYISGKNDRSEKMDMTAPVIRKISKKNKDDNIEMSFYMNYKYQNDNAPVPLDNNTKLTTIEATKFAVIIYSGNANKEVQEEHYETLRNNLNDNKVKYNKDYYFTAGYNSPWDPVKHNEVWIELI